MREPRGPPDPGDERGRRGDPDRRGGHRQGGADRGREDHGVGKADGAAVQGPVDDPEPGTGLNGAARG